MKQRYRYIMGKNCIREVLRAASQRLVEVYTSHSNDDALYDELVKAGVTVKEISKKKLTQMVESDSHQSYIAAVKERGHEDVGGYLKRFFERDKVCVVMLDSIFDPQNVGTILRASECFGVDLVIYSKNRGADITAVVSKTSVGASELVPILKVSNLADTMKRFQKEGFAAVTAEVGEKAESIYSFDFPEKTLIVMGSEGKGVQPLISKKCDHHVYIPMLGNIDSLNVSQAAAVFLNSYQRCVSE
jgi:23S rRNA (guanosine2251-2'-O)-methyltransferase